MKNSLVLSLFILAGCMAGCEMDAKIDLPRVASKLVVTSFISPQDTVLKVKVSETFPIFSTLSSTNGTINNATVVLSDGTRSVTLAYLSNQAPYSTAGTYTAPADQILIQPGKTYFLTVSVPDGRQVKAACTVPARLCDALTTKTDTTTFEQYPGYWYKGYRLDATWQDIAGEGDYYRLYAEVMAYYSINTGQGTEPVLDSTYNRIEFGRGENYVQDAGQDGQQFAVKEGKFTETSPMVAQNGDTLRAKRKIYVSLLTTDQHYYKYHRWLENDTGDNPFAEPTLAYTNIEGGLGVFAAYQRFMKVISY